MAVYMSVPCLVAIIAFGKWRSVGATEWGVGELGGPSETCAGETH